MLYVGVLVFCSPFTGICEGVASKRLFSTEAACHKSAMNIISEISDKNYFVPWYKCVKIDEQIT